MRQPRDHTRGLSRKGRFNLTTQRLRELEKIIRFKFPTGILPASNEAHVYLLQTAKLLFRNLVERKGLPTEAEVIDRFTMWAERWAHFTPKSDLDRIARQAMHDPQIEDADTLGAMLHLTGAERAYLKITTVGACDITKAERSRRRKLKKRKRDRERAARRRRQRGVTPRSEYLKSSLSALRPWEKEGIARRTWERRRKRPK
jgi:hypothetical protein